jgi:hypothetical protein
VHNSKPHIRHQPTMHERNTRMQADEPLSFTNQLTHEQYNAPRSSGHATFSGWHMPIVQDGNDECVRVQVKT